MVDKVLLRHRATNSLVRELVTLLIYNDETIQTRAAYLLKQIAQNGFRFKEEHLIVLFGSLSEMTPWLSKLHVCQMLQYVPIPDESATNLVWFLERNLLDENRFLRAWSYNGFYELAKQHSRYIDYAIEQLERGEMEKAASVKARIRNVRIAMNKLQTRKTKA